VEALSPILGNDEVRARLWRAADDGRLHHCYVFEGPEGVGKATTALRFALYLNCLAEPGPRPCGACRACRQILAGSHPDVLRILPDPERATRVITADQARGIISALQLQRHSARRRVVIVEPADALTEEAANALLKTLEEPPAGTQFVLVTARAGALLQTVRSRSQRVRFGPVPRDELAGWLSGRGLDPALAVESDGSPGAALRLAEEDAAARRATLEALLGSVGQPLHRLFTFTEASGKKGDDGEAGAPLVVDALELALRDVACVAAGRREAVRHPHRALDAWVAALWPGGVARMQQHIADARDRLRLNVNGRTVLDALIAQLNLELSQARR
jgi:DNA polymerase-3 subunit delta'